MNKHTAQDIEIFKAWYPKGMHDVARLLPLDELNEHQIQLFMMRSDFKWHLVRVLYGRLWQQFLDIFRRK